MIFDNLDDAKKNAQIIKDYLGEIYDQASLVIDTMPIDADYRTVASRNADNIKRMAKTAMKIIGE